MPNLSNNKISGLLLASFAMLFFAVFAGCTTNGDLQVAGQENSGFNGDFSGNSKKNMQTNHFDDYNGQGGENLSGGFGNEPNGGFGGEKQDRFADRTGGFGHMGGNSEGGFGNETEEGMFGNPGNRTNGRFRGSGGFRGAGFSNESDHFKNMGGGPRGNFGNGTMQMPDEMLQLAISACSNLAEGDSCTLEFAEGGTNSTCIMLNETLACLPQMIRQGEAPLAPE